MQIDKNKEVAWKLRFENFEKAYRKFSELAEIDNLSEHEQMALIHSFEYTIELAWKTMKDFLTENGFKTVSPKETIRQAYQSEYIKHGDVWMEALDIRNLASHTYEDEILNKSVDFIINKFKNVVEDFFHSYKNRI